MRSREMGIPAHLLNCVGEDCSQHQVLGAQIHHAEEQRVKEQQSQLITVEQDVREGNTVRI